jgi:UDP-glucuronate decarboxylase
MPTPCLTTPRQRALEIVQEDMAAIAGRMGDALDRLQGRSLVVTGAGGMLARYLVETVAWCNRHRFDEPCRVTAVVRRAASVPADWQGATGVQVVEHDARYAARFLGSAEYLVLAATKASPVDYMREPVETMELNGAGLGEWLRLAAELGSRSVLYFSSGEIYGTPEVAPTPETYVGRVDPLSPRAVYAESKRYGETLCLAWQRSLGVPVKIVRPFQVFGPGLRAEDGRAFGSFLAAAAAGRPLIIESTGTARRTFLYLADATVAFWKVLLEGAPGSVYNVGSPEPEVSILELAQRIAAAAGGSEVRVRGQAGNAVPGSPERTCPDISRLRADFGFAIDYSLDDLIARTLEWMRCHDQPA